MAAHTFRVTAPPRVFPMGHGLGPRGGIGAGAVGPTDGNAPTGAPTPAQTPPASSSGASPFAGVSAAWQGFLDNAASSGQVALGAALLGVSVLVLISQTTAGAAAGRGVAGGARRALRVIPGVGALA